LGIAGGPLQSHLGILSKKSNLKLQGFSLNFVEIEAPLDTVLIIRLP
jgi:hypothetical protein